MSKKAIINAVLNEFLKVSKSSHHTHGDVATFLEQQGFFGKPIGSNEYNFHLRTKVKHETLGERHPALSGGNTRVRYN
jgi:hypothetical protein